MTAIQILHKARAVKNDEFYTRLEDIENELQHYEKHFNGKIVYCNCDDPKKSAFWKYFHINFAKLGLKKLISTYYNHGQPTQKMVYGGGSDADIDAGVRTPLLGDGDFRSPECLKILNDCDVVVTNGPFSLTRDLIATIMKYNKKFLIITSKNAITYKEVFPLILNNEIWLGVNNVKEFVKPDGSTQKFGNIGWFTNLDANKRHNMLTLTKTFNPGEYPRYDNYPAWNVDKVADIPRDKYIEIEIDDSEIDWFRTAYPDLEILS